MILSRLISSHVGRDYTAPDYRFHDDPHLTPYNSLSKRDYILSKDGGRRSARYIINEHAELFEKNQIEMVPEVKAFLPAVTLKEEKASVEMLRTFIEGYNVSAATEVRRRSIMRSLRRFNVVTILGIQNSFEEGHRGRFGFEADAAGANSLHE